MTRMYLAVLTGVAALALAIGAVAVSAGDATEAVPTAAGGLYIGPHPAGPPGQA
ncbi:MULTISPECIES: hypothetical protein [unclassified Micromonospora]|uniref:hypothetical protein n=1 Tax=unclassified Micromonospora TaxID=2617518 RepID=UPI002492BBE9|nr:hypothetical protein [Micromonospora sp. AKA38]